MMEGTPDNTWWQACPTEIIMMILRHLDEKSLITCMAVNKRWRNVSTTLCRVVGWQQICEKGVFNGGADLSSHLSWEQKVMSSCLWNFYDEHNLKMRVVHVYDIKRDEPIITNAICKDNLIIFAGSGLSYYNIRNFDLISKKLWRGLGYYDENEFTSVHGINGNTNQVTLHSKACSCDFYNTSQLCSNNLTITGWQMLLLVNEFCYTLHINGELRSHSFDGDKWDCKVLARHYHHFRFIADIYKYGKNIYALSITGDLYLVNSELMQFERICSLHLPEPDTLSDESLKIVLFKYVCSVIHENGVIADTILKVFYSRMIAIAKLYSGGYSVTKIFGDNILICQYFYGKGEIRICRPIYKADLEMIDIYYYRVPVSTIAKSLDSPVIQIMVHADHNSHQLFLFTIFNIVQVKLELEGFKFDEM